MLDTPVSRELSRRRLLAAMVAGYVGLPLVMAGGGAGLSGCRRSAGADEVVLYSSVDEPRLREVVELYTRERAGRVLLVGDTEATKTTGLLQRLVAERDNPRCDVWWSNEAFSTIGLARQGLLEPLGIATSLRALGWPKELIGADDQWIGFAQRARVIAYNTDRVSVAAAPTALADLLRPALKDRIGIARPQFGTTRGHVAALVAAHGAEATEAYLGALKANGVRQYDGNSLVVRAVAQGEIDVGLTDTDDVFAGQRNGWPVAYTLERFDASPTGSGLPSIGPLVIPNTVARVRNGPASRRAPGRPGAERADALVEFLLSDRVEFHLASSEARNIPVRPGLDPGEHAVRIERPMAVRLEDVEARIDEALAIVSRTLGA
jgi:iron(III) transport system substrate-binding protein